MPVVTPDRVEFVEFVEATGDTTRRALYRVFEGDEHVFSVAVGLTRSVLPGLDLTEDEIYERLPAYGKAHVERHLEMNPGWAPANLGSVDARLDVSTSDFDSGLFLKLPPLA